jgi:hypothetical protein
MRVPTAIRNRGGARREELRLAADITAFGVQSRMSSMTD